MALMLPGITCTYIIILCTIVCMCYIKRGYRSAAGVIRFRISLAVGFMNNCNYCHVWHQKSYICFGSLERSRDCCGTDLFVLHVCSLIIFLMRSSHSDIFRSFVKGMGVLRRMPWFSSVIPQLSSQVVCLLMMDHIVESIALQYDILT